ncbi:MAG TPA: cytochrome c oxidase assembly factor Coa1 family protein [Gemmataceae bacterium]|jgi:hypothetical protein|nr:cytochrome c oxidase assembly factor Coa1 family protein [Gemmataceae bacterium]
MTPPNERGWWSRNWKWVVPVGCLAPVVVCCGGIGALVTFVFGAIKSSEPYRDAVARAEASPALQAELGQPIRPGFFPTGSIHVGLDAPGRRTGHADLSIPVSGPKGTATVRAVAENSDAGWTFTTLEAVIPGRERPIDLLSGQ